MQDVNAVQWNLTSPNVFKYITQQQILDIIKKANDPHKRHENRVNDVKESKAIIENIHFYYSSSTASQEMRIKTGSIWNSTTHKFYSFPRNVDKREGAEEKQNTNTALHMNWIKVQ